MDFRFTEDDEKLKTEVRDFVRSEWDDRGIDSFSNSVYSYDVHHVEDDQRIHEYAKKVAERGWYTMHWPEEYGGANAPLSSVLAYRETAAYNGAPITKPTFFAHTLMYYGQDWQKEEVARQDRQRRADQLLAGFQRAERRRGPRQPPDARRAGWR